MIISKDTTPNKELYYLGSVILGILNSSTKVNMKLMDLFELVRHRESISFNLFALTLSWLFLLETINIKDDYINICS